MATTQELLTQLNTTKQAIKTAIVNKGVAMDNVPFTDYADKINEIETGGGGEPTTGAYFVKVIDYDGTVLLESRGNNGDKVTLPTPPTHDRLVFQGWSCSQDIVNNAVTFDDNNIMVGAVYETASGKTEFDITLTKVTGLTVTLKNLTGMTEIDWGDGTVNSTLSHTYATYGDYMIMVSGVTNFGEYVFSSSMYVCTNARFANGVKIINTNSFSYQILTTISIPQTVTSVSGDAFTTCRSLKSIIFPNGALIGGNVNENCYSLRTVVLPKGNPSNFSGWFEDCYALTDVVLPKDFTTVTSRAFYQCYSLRSMVFPPEIAKIGANAFYNCFGITEYDFTQVTQVPTLSNTNAFSGINKICKIYVPDALYDEWIAATNWVTYADYIYKASERS